MSVMQLEPEEFKRRMIHSEIIIPSSSSTTNCGHCFVRYGICMDCRSNVVRRHKGRSFDYLVDGLKISDRAVVATKRANTLITCFNYKKLHLVLDLDHTLLHTVTASKLSEEEKYLIKEADSRDDLWMSRTRLIKLRPFVREFLKEANEMFSMYVYTMGVRDYAKKVLKLIDPENVYFKGRVITKNDSPNIKTLDLVLADESGIVIVDDTPHVWPDHKRNLLEITKYNYFRDGRMDYKRSYAEEKRDESRSDGSLANVLEVLKEVYQGFFSGGVEKELDFDSKDVRLLLYHPCRPKNRAQVKNVVLAQETKKPKTRTHAQGVSSTMPTAHPIQPKNSFAALLNLEE